MEHLHRTLLEFMFPLCHFKEGAATQMVAILLSRLDKAGYKIVEK